MKELFANTDMQIWLLWQLTRHMTRVPNTTTIPSVFCFVVTVPRTAIGNHRFEVVSQPYPNSSWSFVSYIMAITEIPCNAKQLLDLYSHKYPSPE